MWDRLSRTPWMQCALVALVAACVYLPLLGVRPLDFSEGHRAVPGWTMLETGDFWHQRMFGLTYIRKPPGIAWAIAGSSAWLGETVFAARLPSALAGVLMSLMAWWYGRRWFGGARARLAGVGAGLAQALMPLMWSPGRTAEIEMLNNLGTQMFALGLVDLLVVRQKGMDGREDAGPLAVLGEMLASIRDVLIPAAGLLMAALAKGPASLPVLGGVLVGACIVRRTARPLVERGLWLPLIFGLGAAVVLLLKFQIANDRLEAVREDVAGQFLWSSQRAMGVLTLGPVALASAMPTALALLGPLLGRGVSMSQSFDERRIGRTLAWAWVGSIAVLMLAGVSHARYAMPAAVLLPPLVPMAVGVLRERLLREGATRMTLQRLLLIGRPVVWAAVMMLGACGFVAFTSLSPSPDQRAGPAAARLLGGMARDAELWADDAIEARPDVIWLMQKESAGVKVRWAKPQMVRGELPPSGSYLLLRTDPESEEGRRYAGAIGSPRLNRLSAVEIRKYIFTLYQVRAAAGSP